MTTATQTKCACSSCLCIVSLGAAIEKGGQYYCFSAWAHGHPNGCGCGPTGCECHK
ncbi:MAG TPA: metallothionein [Microcoleaceae bacterium UBA10368]|nr:metallothionein [Microcoleaceae cyanobacterium UBA10368]HCV28881.1 metallothionein [Microcoleaceae cyanobacterium UBA9251]